jgi:hypothetical protein
MALLVALATLANRLVWKADVDANAGQLSDLIVYHAYGKEGRVTCSPRLKPGASQATHAVFRYVSA